MPIDLLMSQAQTGDRPAPELPSQVPERCHLSNAGAEPSSAVTITTASLVKRPDMFLDATFHTLVPLVSTNIAENTNGNHRDTGGHSVTCPA